MSPERKEMLQKLSDLSQEDLKGLLKIVERHPDILQIVKKNEAFGIVAAWMKNGAIWITVVVGAYYLGIEKLGAFLTGLM